MINKVKAFMKHPEYLITSPAAKGYLDWVPDELYLKILFRVILKEKCNLKNPVSYNEKMQWLKLNDRKPEYSRMVDKYEVRSFIAETVGDEYLIPCYGVYESFDEIDFSQLPEQFVLKCTHDSGSVVICKDKKNFDIENARAVLTKAMKKRYFSTYREWPYKNVQPRIIIEKYISVEGQEDLIDYKIMCFNGIAKLVEIHADRFTGGRHSQTFYDMDWNKLDIAQDKFMPAEKPLERPANLDKIVELSEKIAKNMYHARVDWYLLEDKIYFGEITFFNSSGLVPYCDKKDDLFMGSLLDLNLRKC